MVISTGISFLPLDSSSQRNNHFYCGFLIYELVIPGRITIPPVNCSTASRYFPVESPFIPFLQLAATAAIIGTGVLTVHGRIFLLMVTIPGFLTLKDLYRRSLFFIFKFGNIIKMKNELTRLGPITYELQIYPMK
jgi:hypothetical protein